MRCEYPINIITLQCSQRHGTLRNNILLIIYNVNFLVPRRKAKLETTMARLFHLVFLSLGLGTMIVAGEAYAQTCRVNIGSSQTGSVSYMEVYEYDYVTEKPVFPGGDSQLMKFINETREYPRSAYERGIQGRVTCSFVVNADGTVSHISVIRGVEPSLNREAIRILSKMPGWTPGRLDGQAVPTRVVWSVPFRK